MRLFSRLVRTSLAVAVVGVAVLSHGAIDRQALVTRHCPHVTKVDPWGCLTVGNGQFAFTADVTGLQTFTEYYYKNGITTESEARWLWHENANPQGYKLSDASREFTSYGKTVAYPTKQSGPAGTWLRENPHILPLPQLSLFVAREGGAPLKPEDVRDIGQTLDLWTGTLTSRYTVDGHRVSVTVACDPKADALAVRIESDLITSGKLGVTLAFPRGHDIRTKNNPPLDWSAPESHTTTLVEQGERGLVLREVRDATKYAVALAAEQPISATEISPHVFRVMARQGGQLEFSLGFAPQPPGREVDRDVRGGIGSVNGGPSPLPASGSIINLDPAPRIFAASAAHWPTFWQSGGAIDFSGSTDPRAKELERRVILSQYLTAVQFVGDFPPQESGLTINTWYGKHHTEMIWWHAAHFALWGREQLLGRNLDWFAKSVPVAKAIAKERGLSGARWPKMIGPDGRESPGGNPLIVWNQPHPIHLAELMYRNQPNPATLARYRELVFETAACMASMLNWDEARKCYHLGPPLWIAQEIYDQATSMNPCYELSYWSRGLQIAQQWRERLGLARNPEWDRMIKAVAPLPQKDGKYVAIESTPDTWDNKDSRHDHPSFLMALGQLPGDGVDRPTMARTLDAVLTSWDWETKIWGWDYPMIAMTAARLGEPKKAVDVLLKSDSPNNAYTTNGHCRQRGDLPVYLPGNGALLAAVAMMAGGWDGAPTKDAPGFPKDGTWVVRAEGLHPLP